MSGKNKCKILKEIRQKIADENDIAYVTSECKYQGECSGTCPRCEAELQYLENELKKRQQKGIRMPIYSDSVSGQAWVRNKKAKTTLARTPDTEQALDLVARAENWLRTHTLSVPILKWNTEEWGEIPADFGRK